jgi:HK97 family phage portal protein
MNNKQSHAHIEQKINPVYAATVVMAGTDQPQQMARNYPTYAKEGFRTNDTVYKCINYLARNAAAVDWGLYADRFKREEIEVHPLLDRWYSPNPEQYLPEFVEDWAGCLLLGGNSFMQAVNLNNNFKTPPDEIYVLRPDWVEVIPNQTGIIGYRYGSTASEKQLMDKMQVAQTKYWCPDDALRGLSPIEVAAILVDMQTSGNKWNLALMQNSARPPGAWVTDQMLTETAYTSMKDDLQKKYQGVRNAGRPPVLYGGLKWQSMSITPAELDWLSSRMRNASDIANIYNIAPMLIGDTSASTFNNMDSAKLASYFEAVFPMILDKLEATANRWLVPKYANGKSGLYLAYKPESVPAIQKFLQEQLAQKSDRSNKIYLAGKCTLDEARAIDGLPPVPGGAGGVFRMGTVLVRTEKLLDYADQSLQKPAAAPALVPENILDQPPVPPALPASTPAKRSRKQAEIESEDDEDQQDHTGVMVAFFLDSDNAKLLAVPGGELASDLHVTLAYLGEKSDFSPSDITALKRVVSSFASSQQYFTGALSGLGRFTTVDAGEPTPVYASVDAAGLPAFREALVEALRSADFTPDTTHGFTPHITLAYVDAAKPMPLKSVKALNLSFDELTLAVGDDRYAYALDSGEKRRHGRRTATKALDLDTAEAKAAYLTTVELQRKRWEAIITSRLKAYMDQERAAVVAAVDQAALPQTAALRVESALNQQASHLKDILVQLYQDVGGATAFRVAKSLKAQVAGFYQRKDDQQNQDQQQNPGLDFANADVLVYLLTMAGEKVTNINAYTLALLQSALEEGVAAGESIPQLVKRVDNLYVIQTPERIQRIVATEVVAASNYGSQQAALQSGLTLNKVWLATEDNHTRPTHAAADGQEVPIEDPFDVGGAQMMFPGDSSMGAPGSEIVYCRCTEFYRRVDTAGNETDGEEIDSPDMQKRHPLIVTGRPERSTYRTYLQGFGGGERSA